MQKQEYSFHLNIVVGGEIRFLEENSGYTVIANVEMGSVAFLM